MYGLPGYFIGKTMPELPIRAILPMLLNLIIYWMTNLDDSSTTIFFEFYLITLMLSLIGNSMGLAAGALAKTAKSSMDAVPHIFAFFYAFRKFLQ